MTELSSQTHFEPLNVWHWDALRQDESLAALTFVETGLYALESVDVVIERLLAVGCVVAAVTGGYALLLQQSSSGV